MTMCSMVFILLNVLIVSCSSSDSRLFADPMPLPQYSPQYYPGNVPQYYPGYVPVSFPGNTVPYSPGYSSPLTDETPSLIPSVSPSVTPSVAPTGTPSSSPTIAPTETHVCPLQTHFDTCSKAEKEALCASMTSAPTIALPKCPSTKRFTRCETSKTKRICKSRKCKWCKGECKVNADHCNGNLIHCDNTPAPTHYPSQRPTPSPTVYPTPYPNIHPTFSPTRWPHPDFVPVGDRGPCPKGKDAIRCYKYSDDDGACINDDKCIWCPNLNKCGPGNAIGECFDFRYWSHCPYWNGND